MFKKTFSTRATQVATALGALALVPAAHAEAIDVAAVAADIAAQAAPVAVIGAAILLLIVGIKAFKWVRAALS